MVEPGPYLKVNFKADAREADIRMLLVEVNGSLAGGPGQLGDWYVRIPEARIAAATDKLKASADRRRRGAGRRAAGAALIGTVTMDARRRRLHRRARLRGRRAAAGRRPPRHRARPPTQRVALVIGNANYRSAR